MGDAGSLHHHDLALPWKYEVECVLGEFLAMNQIISSGVGCTLKQMKRESLSLSIYTHLHITQLFSWTQIQPYVAYCDQYRPVFKMHLSTQRKTDEDNDNELTEGEWVLNLKKKKS